MTLTELRNKANARLATLWTVIQSKEDAYFAKHGQYFGLRWSPQTPIVDGVDTDFVIQLPSRGIHPADVSFSEPQVPFQIMIERINQKEPINTAHRDLGQPEPEPIYAPTGETYKAIVRIELPNGNVWFRERLQDNTDSGWYQRTQIL